MLESLISTWAVFLLIGQELGNEIFALVRDIVPCLVVESECSSTDFFHDFLITGAIEGWLTTEKNEANDSTTPDIAFSTVVLVKDLRGNVVRSSELFIQGLAWVIDKRGSEVNDLDLVKLLVLFKKDVLWF